METLIAICIVIMLMLVLIAWSWFLTRRQDVSVFAIAVLVSLELLLPLILAPNQCLLRAFICVFSVDQGIKIIFYGLQVRSGKSPSMRLAEYVRLLLPFPIWIFRGECKFNRERLDFKSLLFSIGWAILFVLSFVALYLMSSASLLKQSFLLDHTIKFCAFPLICEVLSRMVCGFEHFFGYRTQPLIDKTFQSRSVAEFWQRHNTRVHAWMETTIFRPCLRRFGPTTAVFAVFAASGVLHEIGFAVATSRVDGYQFAFFFLQAPAIIALYQLKHSGSDHRHRRAQIYIASLLWMWGSSMLFFHGVDRVFPIFYASQPWLP